MTNPKPMPVSAGFRMLFIEPEDVCAVFGRVRFGAESLQFVDQAHGLPRMVIREAIPQEDGAYVLYGIQAVHNVPDATWRILRLRTYDGVAFEGVETVFVSERGHWYASTEIVHNPSDGSFLCLKWGPGLIQGGHALWAFGSPDGVSWRRLKDAPVYHDHDAFSATWEPAIGRYVVFQATYQHHPAKPFRDNAGADCRRVLHFRTSADGLHWEPAEDVSRLGYRIPQDRLITPDDQDPPELEFYRLTAFPYAGRYIGMMLNYAPSPIVSGHGPHLGGEWWVGSAYNQWRRPFRDVFAPGPANDVIMHPPITLGGKHLWVIGDKVYGLPEDCIFYVHAPASAAFTTQPFVCPTSPLMLKAAFPGEGRGFRNQSYLMAELLDETGRVMPEYEKEKCLVRSVAGPVPLVWGTPPATYGVSRLAGRTLRLRIYLRDAKIYALTTA